MPGGVLRGSAGGSVVSAALLGNSASGVPLAGQPNLNGMGLEDTHAIEADVLPDSDLSSRVGVQLALDLKILSILFRKEFWGLLGFLSDRSAYSESATGCKNTTLAGQL